MTRAEQTVLGGAGAVAAATLATGLLVEASGRVLGTASPPFLVTFAPAAQAVAALAAAVVLAGIVVAGPRLLRAPRSPAVFAAGLFLATLALTLALNAARVGTGEWSAVFDLGPAGSFEAKNEYLPGLPALSYGTGFFLDRFAELVPALPVNVAGHPPGLLLLLHATGIRTAGALAALCIACAAAVAPLSYAIARSLAVAEPAARAAGLLAALSPALLLYGTTSADAVYAAVGAAAAALLIARRRGLRVLGCGVLALASLGSWALLAVGAWAVVVAGRREGVRRAAALAAGCALAFLAVHGTLAALYGYDPIGALRATEQVYRQSLAEVRPYWFWSLGSPVAWGVTLGLPIAGAALVAAVRGQPAALGVVVVVVVASLGGFTKAETERIWLPFVPLACVAAAGVLPAGRLRLALAALAVQALGTQLLFATVW
jgi:hypothetical protein